MWFPIDVNLDVIRWPSLSVQAVVGGLWTFRCGQRMAWWKLVRRPFAAGQRFLSGETGFHSFPSSDRVSHSTVDFTIWEFPSTFTYMIDPVLYRLNQVCRVLRVLCFPSTDLCMSVHQNKSSEADWITQLKENGSTGVRSPLMWWSPMSLHISHKRQNASKGHIIAFIECSCKLSISVS